MRAPLRTSDYETHLPPHLDDWPHTARAALAELAGRLARANGTSRQRAAAHELGAAETAIRQAWCPSAWVATSISHPQAATHQIASQEIRRWPPTWRYRLAELERAGATRERAIQVTVAEQRLPGGAACQAPTGCEAASRPSQAGR